jgi:early secretory antigenic target protein ESAT-6
VSTDYTRANFGQISTSQADFMLAWRALQDTLTDLEKDLESSLAQWDGAARGEYTRAKGQWDAAAAHMAQVLGNLGTVIGDAHSNYSGAERKNAGIWGG